MTDSDKTIPYRTGDTIFLVSYQMTIMKMDLLEYRLIESQGENFLRIEPVDRSNRPPIFPSDGWVHAETGHLTLNRRPFGIQYAVHPNLEEAERYIQSAHRLRKARADILREIQSLTLPEMEALADQLSKRKEQSP